MPRTIVVNPWHWLDEDGSFPVDARARKRAVRVAQCIEYGGPLRPGEARRTLLACRTRGCEGFLVALKLEDDSIHALCPTCTQGEFLIHTWQSTPWAKGQGAPLRVPDAAAFEDTSPPAARKTKAAAAPDILEQALARLGSTLSASEVRRLVATIDHPGEVIQAVMASVAGPGPTKAAVDRFLPVLMDVWNETPRDELGGRAPSEVYHQGRPAPPPPEEPTRPLNLGLNRPCPCGSGKKYKRCCMASGAN